MSTNLWTTPLAGAAVQTCNARDLWQFVESRQAFSDWIKGRIEKYGFMEGEDWFIHNFMNNSARGRPMVDYHLTIEMAKELAMVENNERGRQVRRYYIECERRAKAASKARISQLLINLSKTPLGGVRAATTT